MLVQLEKFYNIDVFAFKLKSAYKQMRIEFKHQKEFSSFLDNITMDKRKGLIRCVLVEDLWIVDLDLTVLDIVFGTEEDEIVTTQKR